MAKFREQEINLKIAQKDLGEGKIQLTITIPGSATPDIIKGATFALAMQNRLDMNSIQLEDFESKVIEQVGEAQFKAFTNHYTMTVMTPFAISEKNIEPVMEPEFTSTSDVVPGKDFTYTTIITKKPEYKLKSYDPVSVKLAPIAVTEQEIDAQIENMAQRATTTVADEGAEVGSQSEVSFSIETKFKDDGEPLQNLTAEKRIYQMGEGWMPDEFDAQLLGMKADETKTFDYELPGSWSADGTPENMRNVTSTVTVLQVNKKIIPAITDAWVEVNVPEAKNVEGLRKMLHEQGIEYKTREQNNMKLFLVASKLAERLEGSIADEIYEFTRGDMMRNLTEQLKQQNMTVEQYIQSMGMDEQSFGMQFMMQVRETLRQSFALDALARHLKLTLTDEDIEDTLKRMAPGNEERARAEFEGSGRMYQLREAALRTKANMWLDETATYETTE